MNFDPNVPEPSMPWARELSRVVDANAAGATWLENDLNVRFGGLASMAQSLSQQSATIATALDRVQPTAVSATTVLGLIVGQDATPVTKATVSISVPAGYTGAIVQAYAHAYVSVATGGLDSIESLIDINGNTGPIQQSPMQEISGIRYYQARAMHSAFVTTSTTLNVQYRARHRGSVTLNNGANTAHLVVLANFLKGEVLTPPA